MWPGRKQPGERDGGNIVLRGAHHSRAHLEPSGWEPLIPLLAESPGHLHPGYHLQGAGDPAWGMRGLLHSSACFPSRNLSQTPKLLPQVLSVAVM